MAGAGLRRPCLQAPTTFCGVGASRGRRPSLSLGPQSEQRRQQFGGCAAHLPGAKASSSSPRAQPPRARLSGGSREGGRAGEWPARIPGADAAPSATRRGSLPGPATSLRRPAAGGPRAGACARRCRACRPHSPHPLGELVTSCPRPISVRGQSVAPRRRRRVSASPCPLRGGRAGSPGRRRQRRRDRLRKVSRNNCSDRPAAREPPRLPRPSPKPAGPLQVERCRGAGFAAAVTRARRSSAPARCGSGSGSFGGGGCCCCGAVPPVNCLRPRAARQPHSAEGRREPPRAAEDVVSCGASASAPAGTLWKRVGPEPRGPFSWSAEAAPGGAEAASHARLSPRPPGPAGLASFLPPAGPPSELSKLGAPGCGDGGSAGETPRHVRGGRPWAGRGAAAPGQPLPPRPPPGRPRAPAPAVPPRSAPCPRARPPARRGRRGRRRRHHQRPRSRPGLRPALRARGCVSG